jgi:hypothetical protein
VRLGEPLRINAQELLEVLFNQRTGPSSARPTHCLGHAIDMDEQVWTYLVPGKTMKLPPGMSAMRD